MKKKILIVFGTRPEAIKMAPLVRAFKSATKSFETYLCVTAQHREMLDQVLRFFELSPDFDLNLMRPNQNLYTLTAGIITEMKQVMDEVQPDYLFVHGDTTTSMAAALAGFYHNAKICHVEAGLRTYNKQAPYPEELNRQLTGRIADYHFAPTETAKQNLLHERVPENTIAVTGNTVIDALLESVQKVKNLDDDELDYVRNIVSQERDIILVTGHRRENHGQGFLNICKALKEISERTNSQIIYPVHLNPNVKEPVYKILGECPNIKLIPPQPYKAFVWLMDRSKLIITDSGGVQEEAPALGKPVLVMRETTERPEAVEAGTVVLVGTNTDKIVSETISLLSDSLRYDKMKQLHNPYGDGHACERIVKFISEL